MKIPFLDLKRINKPLSSEIAEAVTRVASSGWYVLGPEVRQFESDFAAYCQSPYCIGTANGLDALFLILKCLDLPPGAEIIVPANTYFASILAIVNAGFTPVLTEPDLNTYLMDAAGIEKKISPSTKAVLLVELYGKSGDLTPIREVCDRHNLFLLSDSAQSHGALYRGDKTARMMDAAAYSFYPTKNLGALGDGGAVVTKHETLASKIAERRNYGSPVKYHFDTKGINSRLDEIQAAVLSVKLKRLDADNERRRLIALQYLQNISHPDITLPDNSNVSGDVWHLFVVRTTERERFRAYMENAGIQTDVHYPVPPHQQNAFREMAGLHLPVTEKIHREIVSIPLNPTLSDQEVSFITDTINHYK